MEAFLKSDQSVSIGGGALSRVDRTGNDEHSRIKFATTVT